MNSQYAMFISELRAKAQIMKGYEVVLATFFAIGFDIAPATQASALSDSDTPVALFLQVSEDSGEPEARYLATWSAELNQEGVQQPAQRLLLEIPGEEPVIIEQVAWQAKAGYLHIPHPDDPINLPGTLIPDPNAGPEDFSWRWYGRSADWVVALTAVNGRIAGRIAGKYHRYGIEPRGVGGARLALINSAYWQTHPQSPQKTSFGFAEPAKPVAAEAHVTTSPRGGSGWDWTCTEAFDETPVVVDVLLLYTQGILDRYFSDTNAVEAALRLTVDDANQALANSEMMSFRFVMRGPEFLPDETSPVFIWDEQGIVLAQNKLAGIQWVGAPNFWAFPGNSYVESLREQYWGDIVGLARDDALGEGSCGYTLVNRIATQGYITEPGPDFERFAYLVFDPGCNADRLNLAHELGHQLGMEHDPRNADIPGGQRNSCPGSYGHKRHGGDAQFRFRTVMASWGEQNGGLGPTSCGSPANCPQIDAFSTPDLEWANALYVTGTVAGASPIGIAQQTQFLRQAWATNTLPRIASIAADYRQRPDGVFVDGFE